MIDKSIDLIREVVKLGKAINRNVLSKQNYDTSFDELCRKYKERNGEDDIYIIIYNEPQTKNDLPLYFNTNNFKVFASKVENSLYRYSYDSVDCEIPYIEKNDDNDRKIMDFIVCLLEVFLYNDEYSNKVNRILENAYIMYMEDEKSKNDIIVERNINKIIKQYSDIYTLPLFLDRNNREDEMAVTLKDVFIYPDYEIQMINSINVDYDLKEFINHFLADDLIKGRGTTKIDTLYILGYAGMGKSSLVATMMHHYCEQDDEGVDLFGSKKVICIKLRDINKEWLDTNNPLSFIYQYFGGDIKNDEDNLLVKNKIIIMDGFDELCLIDNVSKTLIHNISYKLTNMNSKLIVTSRPGYINNISDNECIVNLQYFNYEKKVQWFSQYKEINPQINENIVKSICNSKNGIFGLPLIIYMTATKGIDVSKYNNKWELFYEIFHESIYERGYDEIHLTTVMRAQIYRLIAEIAFKMYQTNQPDINKRQIDDIITEQFKNVKKTDLESKLKKCYAINTYFKDSEKEGKIEFCHNDIRDFFVCECIVIRLNECIDNCNEQELITKFQEWFGNYCLTTKTIQFLYGFLEKDNCINNKYCSEEKHTHKIKNVYHYMINNGMLSEYTAVYSNSVKKDFSLFKKIYNIFFAVYSLYHSLYLSLNNNGDSVDVLPEDVDNFRIYIDIGYLKYPLQHIKLSRANLQSTCLSKINLYEMNLTDAELNDTELNGANLMNASLMNAWLINTDLKEAHLEGAHLKDAHLEGACLDYTHLKGCDLRDAFLIDTKLRDADLEGAILRRTYFKDVEIEGANLYEADFKDAIMSKKTYNQCDFTGAFNTDKINIIN